MVASTRREEILIEPYKQLRFGIHFLLLNLVFSALILALFSYFIWDIYLALSTHFQLNEQENLVTLEKLSVPIISALGLALCFIGLTLLFSARYTHQIYGPMVSIRRFLDELIEGKTPQPIKLRSGDQLQDLVERLNLLAGGRKDGKIEGTILEIINFLDLYIEKKKPQKIKLVANDKLYEVAKRLNQLVE